MSCFRLNATLQCNLRHEARVYGNCRQAGAWDVITSTINFNLTVSLIYHPLKVSKRIHKRKSLVQNPDCERAWLKKRRCAIDQQVHSGKTLAAAAAVSGELARSMWTSKHDQETRLQGSRQLKNRYSDLIIINDQFKV